MMNNENASVNKTNGNNNINAESPAPSQLGEITEYPRI